MESVLKLDVNQLLHAEPEDFEEIVPASIWQALYNRLLYGRQKHKGEKPQPVSFRLDHVEGHVRAMRALEWLTASGRDSHAAAIMSQSALIIRDCDIDPKLRYL